MGPGFESLKVHQKVSVINVEGPPVPIPNTEVKLNCAENTWLATARKNRSVLTQKPMVLYHRFFILYISIVSRTRTARYIAVSSNSMKHLTDSMPNHSRSLTNSSRDSQKSMARMCFSIVRRMLDMRTRHLISESHKPRLILMLKKPTKKQMTNPISNFLSEQPLD